MANYDFTELLSPLDFELLSKDLVEAELGVTLENFAEGRDKGIDLRFVEPKRSATSSISFALLNDQQKPSELIVQCKRFSHFANLKSELKNSELPKIAKLKPHRYVLTTSVSLSPQQSDELKDLLAPFVLATGDIFGRERLNTILSNHPEIERRHIKLWIGSTGVLESIVNAGTHVVSREEVERTIAAAKIYVRNASFDEALAILKKHHVCIISGQPGIGKTTLARMLLLYFYDRKHDVVKIESDISEARSAGYHNRPRFYYYDDFLGQAAQADKLNKNEDQKLLDFMASIRDSRDSVFVLTTREYILNQARIHYEKLAREKFDHRTCVIDLEKYSRRIKAQILYNHLHFSALPRDYIEILVARRGYLKIVDHKNYNPRLIEYLTNMTWIGDVQAKNYLDLFVRNLDNPVEIWGHAFRTQLSARARHLLFVLTAMPQESRLVDVESAFTAFHQGQAKKYGIEHSATDLLMALKELDGTFIATRSIQDVVLVRYQNPSIRDFMQNLLLAGEALEDVIETIVFFEQAKWFVDILGEKDSQLPLSKLTQNAAKVLEALKALLGARSCAFVIDLFRLPQRVIPLSPNFAERLVVVGEAIAKYGNVKEKAEWMRVHLADLASRVEAHSVPTALCIDSLGAMKALGYLDEGEGVRLAKAMKAGAFGDHADLDDFESLGRLLTVVPEIFGEGEPEEIRGSYSNFVEKHIVEMGSSSPDELRNRAYRIGDIGGLLEVDTDIAEEKLRNSADEMEAEEESPDDDDERRGSGASSECSDGELDSMFGTLET
jgi:hypothetical protein